MEKISLLHPTGHGDDYTQLSDVTVHDLGFDAICEQLSDKEQERRMILKVMSNMTADPYVAKYRGDIFDDIMKYPDMRNRIRAVMRFSGPRMFLHQYLEEGGSILCQDNCSVLIRCPS